MTRKGDTPPNKGEGVGSMTRTRRHTVYGWGKWWISEAELRKYTERQKALKRMHVAGYTDLNAFLRMETDRKRETDQLRKRERWEKAEMTRLKKKYGLSPYANRTHLLKVWERTDDPDIAKVLRLQNSSTSSDAEKIQYIRNMFLVGNIPPDEILRRTATTVGIVLRKK